MRRMSSAVGLALVVWLLAPGTVLAHANIAGEWNVEWQGGPPELSMQLAQRDAKVTGWVIFRSGEFPIKGTIDGDHFVLEWSMPGGATDETIRFDGTVDGDIIHGVARLSDEQFDRSLYAQRVGP